jgi:uncharacterized protein (TIGR02246 family)
MNKLEQSNTVFGKENQMRNRHLSGLALAALVFGLTALPGMAEQLDKAKEETALQKRAEAFIAAFNMGDAKAVAAFWTEDGEYINLAGTQLKGRAAIEESFKKIFAEEKGAKLQINTTAIRFVTPDLAIEDGTTTAAMPGNGPPMVAKYMIVHVKKDGDWYLASVRDSEAQAPSNFEHLRDLAWLIGEWVDEDSKGAVASVSYEFTENRNFIVSNLVAAIKDVPISGRTQWIGWDASAKQIRSWSFDSNGGFAEAVWSKDGKKMTIKATATLADGLKVKTTSIVTKIDDDHATWQATNRTLDGKPLPDLEVVKMKRVKQQ